MKDFIAAFARNTVFANIVLAMILLAGGLAMLMMVRETFPAFPVDIVIVRVAWPGADPEEVEEGICRRIEEAIEGIEGIEEYSTTAAEQYGFARIEVEESYDAAYVKERVRNAVEAISTFPLDAEKPVTELAEFSTQVLLVALYGEELSPRTLKEWGEQVKEELLSFPEISQVDVWGEREYEIAIEVSEAKLREYGLSFEEIAQKVRSSSLNLSGGVMRTEGEEIRLRTLGRKYTAEDFAKIVVRALPGGDRITLDRIARIDDGFTEDVVLSRFNGLPAVNVVVNKTTEQDTLAIDRAVKEYLKEKQKLLPQGMHMESWAEMAPELRARIRLLTRNGMIGLGLVFVLLWLFLDIRLSFWAGMGMPISIAGALAIMWVLGATVNMISLFGLIMVLGIIVDDAIVVGEAIYVARKRGEPPLKAAVEGLYEVAMPVIGAVTTTIVAFVPLYFVGGFMGNFIAILPVVVISCLTISLVECLLLLPAHLGHLPDFSAPQFRGPWWRRFGLGFHRYTNRSLEWFVYQVYEPFLEKALPWRYVSLALAAALLLTMWGFMDSGILKFQFFPQLDGDSMYANVEFPAGTPLHVSKAAVEKLEASVRRLEENTKTASGKPLIRNMFTLVGDNFGPNGFGSHIGGVRVELLPSEERGIYSHDLLSQWEKEMGVVPGAVSVRYESEENGPGGAPIEVWLYSNDIGQMLAAAEELKQKLRSYEGVYQVEDDYRAGKNEIRLRLKPEARTLGLTTAALARQVSAGFFGTQAVRIQRGRDDIRVRVRYPKEERRRVADFERVRIRTPQGLEVPILSVADMSYGPGFASIRRTDGKRRVSVQAEVDSSTANAEEVFADLEDHYFADLERRFTGVKVTSKGDKLEREESFGPLYVGYPLALLGIFIVIATIFRSYVQPLVIMITVPFGLVGAVLGHLALGYELSIMSFFGMVALSGVVVNDAIVLIECINTNLAEGHSLYDAIHLGGTRRFRAIFLTTVSTVGGLTPLLLEKDIQARFLVPMAISLAAGVAFATLLTLLFIPCLLVVLNDARRLVYWIQHGTWPSSESVEPARLRNLDLMAEDEEEYAELEPAEDGA